LEEDASLTRSLFDWEAWARRFVSSEESDRLEQRKKVDQAMDDMEIESVSDDEVEALELDPTGLLGKKKKTLRHRYRLSLKLELLNTLDPVRKALADRDGVALASIDAKRVLAVLSHNSGVPSSTLDKWARSEVKLRIKFNNKFNRKHKSFGSGAKPKFPKSEAKVGDLVRERRSKHRAVSKEFVIRNLEVEAIKENKTEFDLHGITDDIFFGFISRQRFAFRKPSNVKSLSKIESVKRIRGFWRWLCQLFRGALPLSLGETSAIVPKYGRFPPKCRKSKDEVPARFGGSSNILSNKGESSTILQVIEGWGDRIGTWSLSAGPGGLDLPVAVIFKGTGLKLSEEELSFYKTLKNIIVLFQPNAWVDTSIELKIVELMMKPIVQKVKKSFTEAGELFPGVLLIQDNFSPHFAEYQPVLIFLKYFHVLNQF
jgi:hypothetical protein